MVTNGNTTRNGFDGLWTVEETAQRLRLSESLIRKYVARGKMPVVRIGRRVLLDPDDVRAWIEARKTAA